MKAPDTIYTYAYGFRDCDTLARVWGRTERYATRATRHAMREDARVYRSDNETLTETIDQLWVVGPFKESVADIELEDSSRADEFADDLVSSTSGYLY